MERSLFSILFLTSFLVLLGCGDNTIKSAQSNVKSPTTNPVQNLNSLSIESAIDGNGSSVSSVNLDVGDSLVLYSVERNSEGAYLRAKAVSWELIGSNGSLTIAAGSTSITFTGTQVGLGSIKARYLDGSGDVMTVSINVGIGLRPADLVLAVSDPNTSSSNYLRQQSTQIVISNDALITKWCVSELQITMPFDANANCVGGNGTSSGWHTTRPTSFLTSALNGTKTIYVWGANSLGVVNAGPVSASIDLDETLPADPSLQLSDAVTSSQVTTYSAQVNLAISNDTDATLWCLLDQPSVDPDPATPLFNDSCFVSPKPTNYTLQSAGSRKVFIYTQDVAGNISENFGSATINYILNSVPIANNDSAALNTSSSVNIDVLANDTDTNSDTLTVTSKTDGSNGTVVIEVDNTLTYTPTAGYFGSDSFTYTMSDGRGGTDTATVNINVLSPFTWIGGVDSNWSTAANWCGTVTAGICQFDVLAPGVSDIAVFNASCGLNCDATIDVPVSLKAIFLQSSYTGTLTQGVGNAITLSSSNNKSFQQDGGTFIGSNANINSGLHFYIYGGNFTSTSGILTVGGSVTFAGTSFLHNNGTIKINHSNNVYLNFGTAALNNLNLENTGGTTYNQSLSLNVDGNLTLNYSGGSKLTMNNTIKVKGDVTFIGSLGGDATIELIDVANQTISGLGSLPHLKINKTGGIATFIGDIALGGAYGGNLNYSAGATDFTGTTLKLVGSTDFSYSGSSLSINNLEILKTDAQADIYLANNDLIVMGDILLNSNAGTRFHYSKNIQVYGNVTCASFGGIYSNNASSIKLVGTNVQTISETASCKLPHIIVNKSGGVANFTGNIRFDGDYNHTSGVTDFTGSTVNFVGDYNRSITSGASVFNNIIINNSSNIGITLVDTLNIIGDLTVTSNVSKTGNISMNGGGAQNLSVALGKSLPKGTFTVDNGTALTLTSDIEFEGVGHNINLNNGSIDLAGNDLLEVDTFIISVAANNVNQAVGRLNFLSCDDTGYPGACGILRSDTTLAPYTWIGAVDSNWSNLANWCGDLSNGSCTYNLATPPTSADIAIIDNNCTLNCDISLDTNVNVSGIKILSTYVGTITQNSGTTITVGSGKWDQAAGTFVGGDSDITMNGDLVLSGGIYTSTTANLRHNLGTNFIVSTGTFNHNNGTFYAFGNSGCGNLYVTMDLPTNLTIYNLTLNMTDSGCNGYEGSKFVVSSGDTLKVLNNLNVIAGAMDTGTIDFDGDQINLYCASGPSCSYLGDAEIIFNEAKNQTYYADPGASSSEFTVDNAGFSLAPVSTTNLNLAGLKINSGEFVAPTGTLKVSGTVYGAGFFNITSGTYNHSNGHLFLYNRLNPSSGLCGDVNFNFDVPISVNLYDLTLDFRDTGCNGYDNAKMTVASGDTINVLNNYVYNSGNVSGGIFDIKGNVTFNCTSGSQNAEKCARGGNSNIILSGANIQNLTFQANAKIPTGAFEVNKSSQQVLFLSDVNFTEVIHNVTLTAGEINMNDFNLDVNGDFTLQSGSILTEGLGTLTVNGVLTDNR